MEALREISIIKDHILSIRIPDSFQYEKVEVLIIPMEEERVKQQSQRGRMNRYAAPEKRSMEEHAWTETVQAPDRRM